MKGRLDYMASIVLKMLEAIRRDDAGQQQFFGPIDWYSWRIVPYIKQLLWKYFDYNVPASDKAFLHADVSRINWTKYFKETERKSLIMWWGGNWTVHKDTIP